MLAIHCCWLNTAIDHENYCIETYYKVLKRKVSNLLILVLFMT